MLYRYITELLGDKVTDNSILTRYELYQLQETGIAVVRVTLFLNCKMYKISILFQYIITLKKKNKF